MSIGCTQLGKPVAEHRRWRKVLKASIIIQEALSIYMNDRVAHEGGTLQDYVQK